MPKLSDATPESILQIAKDLCREATGLDYDKLPPNEQHTWQVEASMTYSWLCE